MNRVILHINSFSGTAIHEKLQRDVSENPPRRLVLDHEIDTEAGTATVTKMVFENRELHAWIKLNDETRLSDLDLSLWHNLP